MKKKCSACGKSKPVAQFYSYLKKTDRDGRKLRPKEWETYYRSECIPCNLEIRAARRWLRLQKEKAKSKGKKSGASA